MTKQPIDESHSSSKRIKKNQIGDTEKSPETADHLASFVATVLRDRSTHDLVKENQEFKKKQLLLQITVEKRIGDLRTGEKTTEVVAETSLNEGYFMKDRSGKKLFCVDLPPMRDENSKMRGLIDEGRLGEDWGFRVLLGGIQIYHNCGMDINVGNQDYAWGRGGGIWRADSSCVEFFGVSFGRYKGKKNLNLLGLAFDPSSIPGVIALLDQKVLTDVRDWNSVNWGVNCENVYLSYSQYVWEELAERRER